MYKKYIHTLCMYFSNFLSFYFLYLYIYIFVIFPIGKEFSSIQSHLFYFLLFVLLVVVNSWALITWKFLPEWIVNESIRFVNANVFFSLLPFVWASCQDDSQCVENHAECVRGSHAVWGRKWIKQQFSCFRTIVRKPMDKK